MVVLRQPTTRSRESGMLYICSLSVNNKLLIKKVFMSGEMRKGGWRSTQRAKLTASRGPHKSNPKNFYYDAETASERLNSSVRTAGDIPEEITRDTELERFKLMSGYEGISWRRNVGRKFTEEYWNPLVGLWVDKRDLDFVLDLLLEGVHDPDKAPFLSRIGIAPWTGLRRYLFVASEEDYNRAKARVEPIFEELFEGAYSGELSRDMCSSCDGLAFAFSRGSSEWADRCIQTYFDNPKAYMAQPEALTGATLDAELAHRYFKSRTTSCDLLHVYDMIESLGGDAVDIIELLEPRDSYVKKIAKQALGVAQKVAAL